METDKTTFVSLRATPAAKERLTRLQGQLQAIRGRKISAGEALEFALASVEAQWPVGATAKPGEHFITADGEPGKPAA